MQSLTSSWITVNRSCNFRCQWCYAKETKYYKSFDMDIALARNIVSLLSDLSIQDITILGGEPTLWSGLFELSKYIISKNISPGIITNGYRLSEKDFINQLVDVGINNVNISLKAGNEYQYKKLTGTDAYDRVKKAIENVSISNINCSVSITVNNFVIDNLIELVSTAFNSGASKITIQFCFTTFENGVPNKSNMLEPKFVTNKIIKQYSIIDKITKGNIYIHQSLPRCIWRPSFLKMLENKGQIISGCQLLRGDGLVFDTLGNLILCNHLHDYILGKYGVDFSEITSFNKFRQSTQIINTYNKIISYPSLECMECRDYLNCGGGCPLQWFIFEPKKVIERR